jgi:hypothetical protein
MQPKPFIKNILLVLVLGAVVFASSAIILRADGPCTPRREHIEP